MQSHWIRCSRVSNQCGCRWWVRQKQSGILQSEYLDCRILVLCWMPLAIVVRQVIVPFLLYTPNTSCPHCDRGLMGRMICNITDGARMSPSPKQTFEDPSGLLLGLWKFQYKEAFILMSISQRWRHAHCSQSTNSAPGSFPWDNPWGESTLPLHLICDNDPLDAARDRTLCYNHQTRRDSSYSDLAGTLAWAQSKHYR